MFVLVSTSSLIQSLDKPEWTWLCSWLPVRFISGKHGFGERVKIYSEFYGNCGGSLSIYNCTDYFSVQELVFV